MHIIISHSLMLSQKSINEFFIYNLVSSICRASNIFSCRKFWHFFWEQSMTKICRITINLSPQFLPKPLLLMNLLRQKVSFSKNSFIKKPSERSGRLWTDCHSVLYECTALTSWATGPLLSIVTLFITFQNKIHLKILTHVLCSNPAPTTPIKYRTIIL